MNKVKKRKSGRRGGRPFKEKPRMCDPGMCDHCQYIGEGDFICDRDLSDPEGVLVVEDWEPTANYLSCRKGGRR